MARMMKLHLGIVAVSAFIVVVYTAECKDNTIATCGGINCTDAHEEVGCDHHVCTCVPKKQNCLLMSDCMNIPCPEHDRSLHCVDGKCDCIKYP